METVQAINCITHEKLHLLISEKRQQVKIVDVRSREEYDETHIPGAINIAILEIELANRLFDKKDFLITVCGKGGGGSTQAAERLHELGFRNSIWLCGGTFGWTENI